MSTAFHKVRPVDDLELAPGERAFVEAFRLIFRDELRRVEAPTVALLAPRVPVATRRAKPPIA